MAGDTLQVLSAGALDGRLGVKGGLTKQKKASAVGVCERPSPRMTSELSEHPRSERRPHPWLKLDDEALAGVAQWMERRLRTKGSLVRFPVRAHSWVVDQVPSGGHERGNHTLMFLSLSFSFPSLSLKINK